MILNFTITELCRSETAKKAGINNTPPMGVADNLMLLIVNLLQPLREKLGKPVIITSGYRCAYLNKLVGGKETSQHVMGQAADIRVKGIAPAALCAFIKSSGLTVDQCINEYDQWVHVSYRKEGNRNQYFKL